MATIILVTSGARSGKSWFAEELCRELDCRVGYIATSQVQDDEMEIRIRQHQIRRPDHLRTLESPECDQAVLSDAREYSDVLLCDCLTLYLTYWMLHDTAPKEIEKLEKWLLKKLDDMLASFREWSGTLIFITNEVGFGIVPENNLACEFRDLSGKMNARVAQEIKEVYLVIAGQALPVKKYAVDLKEAISSWNLKKRLREKISKNSLVDLSIAAQIEESFRAHCQEAENLGDLVNHLAAYGAMRGTID